MSEFSLHQWLQSEQAAGTLESEGQFTIVQSKAWEKLGAFQLPFPEAWVLKLVQAALATDDTQLAIVQTREETRFDYLQAPDWTSAELEKAIFDTSYKAERSLDHLAIAVRSLALKKTRPFSLRYSEGTQVAWTGTSFTPLDTADPSPGTFSLTVTNYEFGQSQIIFSTSHSQAAGFRADIAKAVTSHCHLARHRVTLDGRRPDCYLADPDFGLSSHSQPLTLFKAEPVQEWNPIAVVGEFYFTTAQLRHKKVDVALPTEERMQRSLFATAAVLTLFFRPELHRRTLQLDKWSFHSQERQSQILWYSDGVIVHREPLPFEAPVGLGVIISTEGLAMDLTGFNPLDRPTKQARIAHSFRLIREKLSAFRDSVGDQLFKVGGLRDETKLSGVLGAGVAVVAPMLGVPWVLASGYQATRQMQENKALQADFNSAFVALVNFVATYKVT